MKNTMISAAIVAMTFAGAVTAQADVLTPKESALNNIVIAMNQPNGLVGQYQLVKASGDCKETQISVETAVDSENKPYVLVRDLNCQATAIRSCVVTSINIENDVYRAWDRQGGWDKYVSIAKARKVADLHTDRTLLFFVFRINSELWLTGHGDKEVLKYRFFNTVQMEKDIQKTCEYKRVTVSNATTAGTVTELNEIDWTHSR